MSSFILPTSTTGSGWICPSISRMDRPRQCSFLQVLEKSLGLDNVFAIAMIFTYFRIPPVYQHRVLFWGVVGALVMRAVMILAGVALIERFNWILYLFGAFLIVSGAKMAVTRH